MEDWAMFGLFKKKQKIEDTDAYKMGQKAAASFADDLDDFMAARFEPVFKNLMAVLDDRLETVYDDPNGPPIALAKMEYQIFLDNVKDKRPDMQRELDGAMAKWLSVAAQMDLREDFEKLITARLNGFYERLNLSAIQALIDKADVLKPADIQWREQNPELATQFPEPE
jgi:hypothetical protein